MNTRYLSDEQCAAIRNLPRERGVHVYPPQGKTCPHLDVMKLSPYRGNPVGKNVLIGKAVNGVYLPLEEYRKLYDRAGKKRGLPENPQKRKYERRKPVSLKRRACFDGIEGLPSDLPPEATVVRTGANKATVYVAVIHTSRDAGKRKYSYDYQGRIKDGRFYTMEDYRRLFDRFGRPRKGADGGER